MSTAINSTPSALGGTTVERYGDNAAGRTTSVTTNAGTTSLSCDYEDRVAGIKYPSSATNSFDDNGLDTRDSKVNSTGCYTYRRDGADVNDPVLSDGAAAYTRGGVLVLTGLVALKILTGPLPVP